MYFRWEKLHEKNHKVIYKLFPINTEKNMNINFVVIKFLIIQSEIRLERQIKEYNIKKITEEILMRYWKNLSQRLTWVNNILEKKCYNVRC